MNIDFGLSELEKVDEIDNFLKLIPEGEQGIVRSYMTGFMHGHEAALQELKAEKSNAQGDVDAKKTDGNNQRSYSRDARPHG